MNDEVNQGTVTIGSEADIIAARKTVRELASRLGFGLTDVTRLVTASSELARNIFLYAGSGVMVYRVLHEPRRIGVELSFQDHGPGIPDIELAMQDNYSTSGGLGMGLPGAKRLVDEFELISEVGKGTRVTVRKWNPK